MSNQMIKAIFVCHSSIEIKIIDCDYVGTPIFLMKKVGMNKVLFAHYKWLDGFSDCELRPFYIMLYHHSGIYLCRS